MRLLFVLIMLLKMKPLSELMMHIQFLTQMKELEFLLEINKNKISKYQMMLLKIDSQIKFPIMNYNH